MVATCFLLGIVRTFQGLIYDIYFSNSLYIQECITECILECIFEYIQEYITGIH